MPCQSYLGQYNLSLVKWFCGERTNCKTETFQEQKNVSNEAQPYGYETKLKEQDEEILDRPGRESNPDPPLGT